MQNDYTDNAYVCKYLWLYVCMYLDPEEGKRKSFSEMLISTAKIALCQSPEGYNSY
jgi:hypothetical protein